MASTVGGRTIRAVTCVCWTSGALKRQPETPAVADCVNHPYPYLRARLVDKSANSPD